MLFCKNDVPVYTSFYLAADRFVHLAIVLFASIMSCRCSQAGCYLSYLYQLALLHMHACLHMSWAVICTCAHMPT